LFQCDIGVCKKIKNKTKQQRTTSNEMFDAGMDFSVTHAPPEGHRWVCEIDGRLCSEPKVQNSQNTDDSPLVCAVKVCAIKRAVFPLTHIILILPVFIIFQCYAGSFNALNEKPHELWRAPLEQQPGGLFLAAPSTQGKAFVTALYHNGLVAALEVLAKHNSFFSRVVRLLASPPVLEGDHHPLLAPHPTSAEVAVAVREDMVRLMAGTDRLATDFKTKHRVLCLAWRPYATNLAAGCSAGLLLWTCNYQV